MAYCRKCGKVIDDEAVICPLCGVEQRIVKVVDDDGSILWAVIGFIIPPLGIFLWIVWHDTKPKSSKMAGMGALTSILVAVALVVLIPLVLVIVGAAS